jgi:hybrid cluster-associated redox disulfide protein
MRKCSETAKPGYLLLQVYMQKTVHTEHMELTPDSTIYDLLKAKPESAEVLFKFGMGCVGCAIARGETIKEAAMAHGIPLDELVSALGIAQ